RARHAARDADGVCVDEEGRSIDSQLMADRHVEQLEQWASLIGSPGLLILEEHSLSPTTARRFLDECESLHIDAVQALARRPRVSAESFVLSAAGAGLFARTEDFRRYPRLHLFTRFTLGRFERRPYRIRLASPEDFGALLALERECWPEGLQYAEAALHTRTLREGAYVLDVNGDVAGVLYVQRISGPVVLRGCRREELDRLYDPHGSTVQLMGLSVRPALRVTGVGDQFLTFYLGVCELRPEIDTVVGVTRCVSFDGTRYDFAEYVRLRDSRGRPVDPNLRLHESHGATIGEPCPHFCAADTANQGYGVLVTYDLASMRTRARQAFSNAPADAPRADAIHGRIADEVLKSIRNVLDRPSEWNVPADQPLMEMGLDSVGIMELRALLQEQFGVTLGPTFLFSHRTLQAVVEYFVRHPGRHLPEPDSLPLVDKDRAHDEAPVPTAPPEAEPRPAAPIDPAAIAIIGMAYRFPGGDFWSLMADGRDAIAPVPPDRWQWP